MVGGTDHSVCAGHEMPDARRRCCRCEMKSAFEVAAWQVSDGRNCAIECFVESSRQLFAQKMFCRNGLIWIQKNGLGLGSNPKPSTR